MPDTRLRREISAVCCGQPGEDHHERHGGDCGGELLLFRDYLRAHPAASLRYAEAKGAGARRWSDDGWAYTDSRPGAHYTRH
jgi:GrpB-like predicted nucleotidyltransferase (UPF0157 family)